MVILDSQTLLRALELIHEMGSAKQVIVSNSVQQSIAQRCLLAGDFVRPEAILKDDESLQSLFIQYYAAFLAHSLKQSPDGLQKSYRKFVIQLERLSTVDGYLIYLY